MLGGHKLNNQLVNGNKPEFGPAILFFSGGTALESLARILTRYSHNTIHIITTFDSGGSSAALRQAFGMPAVGDIRHRLVALADLSIPGVKTLCEFFERRLEFKASGKKLLHELDLLVAGKHLWNAGFDPQMATKLWRKLEVFRSCMPETFNLRGAAVGNMILAADYLEKERNLLAAIRESASLLNVKGTVQPVSDCQAHLAVHLASGRVLVGQHLFTDKKIMDGVVTPVQAEGPIKEVWLAGDVEHPGSLRVRAHPDVPGLLARADLICYPVGSFYSSIVANLLPAGVSRAVANSEGKKVFVPNPGPDPELFGHTLQGQVEALLKAARKDDPAIELADILNVVVVDRSGGSYSGELPKKWLEKQGVAMLDFQFSDIASSQKNFVRIQEQRLSKLLVAMAGM